MTNLTELSLKRYERSLYPPLFRNLNSSSQTSIDLLIQLDEALLHQLLCCLR
jgi:hypothetical protein